MVALKVEEQKAFTAGLFIGEIFDKFLVQGSGDRDLQPVHHRRKGPSGLFFRRGTGRKQDRRVLFMEDLKAGLLLLNQRKTACRRASALYFRCPHPPETGSLPGESRESSPDQVGGLYINVQYENHEMICVTGTSMKQFTLDQDAGERVGSRM